MRLTRYTDYALRVLIYLGLRPERRSTIREISQAYGISRNHLMKIVQQLVAEGLVHSARGVGGGLTLAPGAEQTTVGAIVRATEPDFDLVECMQEGNECVITPVCALAGMLRHARQAFHDALDEYRLADLFQHPEQPDLARRLNIVLKTA